MTNYDESSHQPMIIAGEQNPAECRNNSNTSVTSLALGILSLIFFWIPHVTFFMSLAGLILGIVSLAKHHDGHKMAIAGVITSAIGIPLSIITGAILLILLSGAA